MEPSMIFAPGTAWSLAPLGLALATAGLALVARGLVTVDPGRVLPAQRLVVLGVSDAGLALFQDLQLAGATGYQVLGFVRGPGSAEKEHGVPMLGASARLGALSDAFPFDAVVLGTPEAVHLPEVRACVERGLDVLPLSAIYERAMSRIPVPHIDASWFVHDVPGKGQGPNAVVKRILDLGLAAVGLAGTALLLPAIATAIRLGGGPGPIFYSQRRVGLGGRTFEIYKFRTMRTDAEAAGVAWAAERDTRITPVGRFLRRTRLDELPQFWNVALGDMSVVGPRPERPEFVEMLAREIPFYNQRHVVSPGLTGWAQVMFPYGASVEDALGKLQYDLFYLKNRSLLLDLKIMVKTIGVMACKIGSR